MEYKTWEQFFKDEFEKSYYKELEQKVSEDETEYIIYPKKEDRLNAFKFTPLDDVKVVILGQDPYINENQAMGLSFSVPEGEKIPPSLKNIFKEIEATTNCDESGLNNIQCVVQCRVIKLRFKWKIYIGLDLQIRILCGVDDRFGETG